MAKTEEELTAGKVEQEQAVKQAKMKSSAGSNVEDRKGFWQGLHYAHGR